MRVCYDCCNDTANGSKVRLLMARAQLEKVWWVSNASARACLVMKGCCFFEIGFLLRANDYICVTSVENCFFFC